MTHSDTKASVVQDIDFDKLNQLSCFFEVSIEEVESCGMKAGAYTGILKNMIFLAMR